jgi:quercetin dioxygenase-like cupin family protein
MKRSGVVVRASAFVGLGIVLLGGSTLTAQDPLTSGTILKRTELAVAEGLEAILVVRDVPAGAESGRHTQSGNEIVYILEGSVVLQVEGKPDLRVATGEAFTTSKGEVHNVKNGSDTEPVRALAFYIAKTGASLEDLAVPAQ